MILRCERERAIKKSPSPWYVVGRVKVERVITSCVKHDQSTTGSFLSYPPLGGSGSASAVAIVGGP